MVMVYKIRMADGAAARTDGVSIWVDDRLNAIEEKCAVAHEMVHIERGEGTCQPEYIELEVRYETARRLLPVEGIGSCDGETLQDTATRLGVTRRVLMDRAVTLTRDQSIAAGCFSCLKCPSQRARMRETLNEVMGNERHPRPQPPQELISVFDTWKQSGPHAAADFDSTRNYPWFVRRAAVAA